eukprot:9644105-Heterocapsa_arctica.AAC.1
MDYGAIAIVDRVAEAHYSGFDVGIVFHELIETDIDTCRPCEHVDAAYMASTSSGLGGNGHGFARG